MISYITSLKRKDFEKDDSFYNWHRYTNYLSTINGGPVILKGMNGQGYGIADGRGHPSGKIKGENGVYVDYYTGMGDLRTTGIAPGRPGENKGFKCNHAAVGEYVLHYHDTRFKCPGWEW